MVSTVKLCKLPVACVMGLSLVLCGCRGLVNGSPSGSGNIQAVNHIIFMVQENRSFDTYFGQLPAYWQTHGFPAQQFDGIPANASNPSYDGKSTVSAYHVATECVQNLSPSWNESHVDWNRTSPTSSTATMDGYVYNAAKFANDENAGGANPPYTDVIGARTMGYYDGTDLNYYYYMASNFATSDNWFSPVMNRTQVNRMYFFAATSQGYAYPPGTAPADTNPLTAPTIFDSLTAAGISWKIYATDNACSGFCTYLTQFKNYSPPNPLPANVVSASEFLSDASAGTLPAVSFIESGSSLDEHPSSGTNTQTGAAYVETLINGFMSSQSWKDSVFILTYDEAGGTYDHVAPLNMPNPDGIAPIDLASTDICG